MIIDSIQQLHKIKERTLFIYPIQKDERLHNITNSIIGLVAIDVQTKQSYILSISHPEGIYQTSDLSFLKDNTI